MARQTKRRYFRVSEEDLQTLGLIAFMVEQEVGYIQDKLQDPNLIASDMALFSLEMTDERPTSIDFMKALAQWQMDWIARIKGG